MKIAVVGNCQSQALANCLERAGTLTIKAVLDVNVAGSEAYGHAQYAVANDTLGLDFVLTQPISNNFPDIATAKLKEIYGDRLLTFTNIFFEGLHPDITYFGSFGERIQSPLGDYHSRIALIGFLKGMSESETLALYNAKTYEALGYFRRFGESAATLRQRDEGIDIQFSRTFLGMVQDDLPLYSVNHPTPVIIRALASQISKTIGAGPIDIPSSFFPNSLVGSNVWPIYPEVSEAHGLGYATPMMFFPQHGMGNPTLPLEKFVNSSFAIYQKYGRDRFLKEEIGRSFQNAEV